MGAEEIFKIGFPEFVEESFLADLVNDFGINGRCNGI